MAKLTFILEDGQEVEVTLRETITIGCSEGNSVVVDDDRISPRHAEILVTSDGRMMVCEVDVGAGTFVNDQRVQNYPLRHGDRLAFGPLKALLDAEEELLPPPSKIDPNEYKAKQVEIATQEKRLADLQKAAELAEARQIALIASIQTLVAEQEEKTAALKKLDTSQEALAHALKELSAQQEKEASHLKQLGAEKAQEEQRLADLRQQVSEVLATQEKNEEARLKQLKQQIEALEVSRQQLESLAATHQSQANTLSVEIATQEQRANAVKQDLQSAEAKLAQVLGENREAEERSGMLTTSLAALQEEYEELTEVVEDLQKQMASHKAELSEQTRLVQTAKELHYQLEVQCQKLEVKKLRLGEACGPESNSAEIQVAEVIKSIPDSTSSSFTTNRIVPRVVSAETITPRPRGIPMKSERITRKGSAFPNKAES
jgi:pSer/pThr/pTyr-binding forkhead associated (FHA) protein